MPGVYFIVVSGKDGASVRHIQLERAGEASDRHVRSVCVRMPVVDESGKRGYEIQIFDHLFLAVQAYRLLHALTESPYCALVKRYHDKREAPSVGGGAK